MRVATPARKNTVELWDIETGERQLVFDNMLYEMSVLSFSPDGMLNTVNSIR